MTTTTRDMPPLEMRAAIRPNSYSEDKRTVQVVWTTGAKVRRGGVWTKPYDEELEISAKAIRMERLNGGAPVLDTHDAYGGVRSILGVVERAWLEGKEGIAELRFSEREDVAELLADIASGVIRNVSVGYRVHKYEVTEEDGDVPVKRAVDWEPYEISFVPIGADAKASVRSEATLNPCVEEYSSTVTEEEETREMSKQATPDTTQDQERAAPPVQQATTVDLDAVKREAVEEFQRTEQKRQADIRGVFGGAFAEQHRSLLDECLGKTDCTADQARQFLLEAIGKDAKPLAQDIGMRTGEDEKTKFRKHVEAALACRQGFANEDDKKIGETELRGYTLYELARRSLEFAGERTGGMSRSELVGRAFTHSSSDFPLILSNTANKAMLKGYDEVEETFTQFTRSTSLPDYKTHDRVGTGSFASLPNVREGGEYTYGAMDERREQVQLEKYGKLFSITEEAIVNDDLNMFNELPRKMGRAARRTVGDSVYGLLTGNPAMSDTYALFHTAQHSNLLSSGTAPSLAALSAVKAAMAKQKDSSLNATLNIRPKFVICPVALEDTFRTLIMSETDNSNSNSRVPNIHRNRFEVIADARLDEDSALSWYVLADPNQYDTIEVAYLDGVQAPLLQQMTGWKVDGVEFKVKMVFDAAPLEWRTMYKNPGSS